MSDIWYMLSEQDRYVYHYTKASTLTDCILADERLRFSRFENVNDPRESKNWRFNYHLGTTGSDFDTSEIETALNRALKYSRRIGCFVSDPYEALATREREFRGEDILGAMYERGHSRPRMWAQYGKNYTGACLIFDKAKLDADIRASLQDTGSAIYADKVTYQNLPVVPNLSNPNALTISIDEINQHGLDGAVERHVSRFWKELFFVKNRDWEQEREYRWVVNVDSDHEHYVGIRGSLVGIALGDQFPSYLKPTVGNFVRLNPTVSLAIMDWKNGLPQPQPTHWRLLLTM